MTNEELHLLISKHMPNSQVIIGGDGHHFEATIISEAFSGLSKIKRQQMIYQALALYITSGAIHALNLNTYTPEEWEKQHG
jgi:acid stress-induced BolA-like protein IbaG/YrbA